MSNIIEFEIGCRKCVHLMQMGKDTFTCNKLNFEDGTSIYPIEDGRKTEGWGACHGEYREVAPRKTSKRKKSV